MAEVKRNVEGNTHLASLRLLKQHFTPESVVLHLSSFLISPYNNPSGGRKFIQICLHRKSPCYDDVVIVCLPCVFAPLPFTCEEYFLKLFFPLDEDDDEENCGKLDIQYFFLIIFYTHTLSPSRHYKDDKTKQTIQKEESGAKTKSIRSSSEARERIRSDKGLVMMKQTR